MKNKIVFIILGIIIGVIIMAIGYPKRIAQLSDGSEEIVFVGDKSFSANEYYDMLKDKDKINTLLREIDLYLTKKMYPNQTKESTDYANERYDMFVSQAEAYGMDEATALLQYGYKTKSEFIEYLKDDYYLNHYYMEKLDSHYSEEELKKYYDENYFAPRSIYIFSNTDKKVVESVKKKIDKGTKISEIIGTSSVAYNQVDLTFMSSEYGSDILSKALITEEGKASDVFASETYGYATVYVSNIKAKQSFEELRKDIIEVMLTKLEEEDPNIMYKVMIELQKENNISFKDSELQKEYSNYISEHNK